MIQCLFCRLKKYLYQRWSSFGHLEGKLYNLPGGAISHKYVDLLSEEVSYLSAGNYTADPPHCI